MRRCRRIGMVDSEIWEGHESVARSSGEVGARPETVRVAFVADEGNVHHGGRGKDIATSGAVGREMQVGGVQRVCERQCERQRRGFEGSVASSWEEGQGRS